MAQWKTELVPPAPRIAVDHMGEGKLVVFSHISPGQSREFVRLRLEPLLAGKELKEIAPGVAQSLISKSAPPAVFQRFVDSMCTLHRQSYIKTLQGAASPDVQIELEKICVPAHVVVGAEDMLTPPSLALSMAARSSGARLPVIKTPD